MQNHQQPTVQLCNSVHVLVLLLAFFLSGFANGAHEHLPSCDSVGSVAPQQLARAQDSIANRASPLGPLGTVDLTFEVESDEEFNSYVATVKANALDALLFARNQDEFSSLGYFRVALPPHALGARAPPAA